MNKKEKKDLTIKSNRGFLRSYKLEKFNLNEKLIYEYLKSLINEKLSNLKEEEIKDYENIGFCSFRIRDIINEFKKYSKKKLNYSRLLEDCINLPDKKVIIDGYINNNRAEGKFNIFEGSLKVYPEKDVKAGTLCISFTNFFLKNLIRIQDKNGWQKYQWGRLVQIYHDAGIDLYLFFKSHEWEAIHSEDRIYKKTFTTKEMLDFCLEKDENGKYINKEYEKNISSFEKRVLDPMCEAFNNSDLKFFKYENIIAKGKNKGKEIKKSYIKEKKGYTFVCDFSDSDYFRYNQNKNIVENKKILKDNQNKYNAKHRKNTTSKKNITSREDYDKIFFEQMKKWEITNGSKRKI